MHKGHINGSKKNFQPEKIKIEVVAFVSEKKLKSHFRDPISYFEMCFYNLHVVSTFCKLGPSLTKFL